MTVERTELRTIQRGSIVDRWVGGADSPSLAPKSYSHSPLAQIGPVLTGRLPLLSLYTACLPAKVNNTPCSSCYDCLTRRGTSTQSFRGLEHISKTAEFSLHSPRFNESAYRQGGRKTATRPPRAPSLAPPASPSPPRPLHTKKTRCLPCRCDDDGLRLNLAPCCKKHPLSPPPATPPPRPSPVIGSGLCRISPQTIYPRHPLLNTKGKKKRNHVFSRGQDCCPWRPRRRQDLACHALLQRRLYPGANHLHRRRQLPHQACGRH